MVLAACGDDTKIATTKHSVKARTATEKDFEPQGNFAAPTRVDNRWNPLVPGTQLVYDGRSNRGLGQLPHRVIVTVTALTKRIEGVDTVVVFERDINEDRLSEAEITFAAQDDDGTVWNFGEYPEEYGDDGSFEGAPSTWLSGSRDARAGIIMRGDPRTETPPYLQGDAPKIDFGDTSKILRFRTQECVPVGCYAHVLVIDETNPLSPGDGHQLKYYASGIGTISVAPGRGGKEREVLELVKIRKLRPKTLDRLQRDALRLDRRAYKTVPKVWGSSERVKLAS